MAEEETLRRCTGCDKKRPLSMFRKRSASELKQRRNVYRTHCKICEAEESKKRKEKNKEAEAARAYVEYMVNTGKMVKPEYCEVCQKKKLGLEGHHIEGYDKEHRLVVIWACKSCHQKFHAHPELQEDFIKNGHKKVAIIVPTIAA